MTALVVAGATAPAATAAPPPAAAATSAAIDGITHDASGAPAPMAVAVLRADTGKLVHTTQSHADGTWRIPGLDTSIAYKVVFNGEFYWADNALNINLATPVTAPAHLVSRLPVMGTLRGTVKTAAGLFPSSGVDVMLYRTDGTFLVSEHLSTDPHYSFDIPVGTYKVRAVSGSYEVWFTDSPDAAGATVVKVRPGRTRVAVMRLPSHAAVTGLITDATTGAHIAGVCARIVVDVNQEWVVACTDSTGRYRAEPAEPGSYALAFEDPDERPDGRRYVATYSGGTRTLADATRITIPETGDDVTYNQTMSLGATLRGRVVDSVSGQPVKGVWAYAYDRHRATAETPGVFGAGALFPSDADGRFTVSALPTGTYTLLLSPTDPAYPIVWYGGSATQAASTRITVTAPDIKRLPVSRLVRGGTVSGTVTDEAGHPLFFASVDFSQGDDSRPVAYTDQTGHYSIGVPVGTYRPMARYLTTFAAEWSGNATSRETATDVVATAGGTTTVDYTMHPGGHIIPTFVYPGSPDKDLPSVDVYTLGGQHVAGANWNGNGQYSTDALPPGDFIVTATQNGGRVSWYDGSTTRAGATAVHLDPLAEKAITFHIP